MHWLEVNPSVSLYLMVEGWLEFVAFVISTDFFLVFVVDVEHSPWESCCLDGVFSE